MKRKECNCCKKGYFESKLDSYVCVGVLEPFVIKNINVEYIKYKERRLKKVKNNLYFIENQGCDATTYGLVMVNDEEFPKFKLFIENLNKNSYYGCMPVISVYKINMSVLKEIDYNPKAEVWNNDYVDKDYVFYLDNKTYTFAKEYFSYYSELECVIKGRN